MVQVKREEMESELTKLQKSFMPWDNQRRMKVTVVLESLDHEDSYVDKKKTEQRVRELTATTNHRDLTDSALKLFNLEFNRLSLSKEEKQKQEDRYKRAEEILERFEQLGML